MREENDIATAFSNLMIDEEESAASLSSHLRPSAVEPSPTMASSFSVAPSNSTVEVTSDELSTAPSALLDAARITDWPLVLELSQNSPHLASFKCADNITPLLHVCTRRCPYPDVVSALIHAHPPALVACDERGWTPLHHASRFKAPKEAIWLLLNLYPEMGRWCAKKRCSQGRTPLYYALSFQAPSGVLEVLLRFMKMEDVLDVDRDGNSVLSLAWDKWALSLEGKRVLSSVSKKLDYFDKQGKEEDGEKVWEERIAYAKKLRAFNGSLKERWDMANLLLKGAFRFPLENDDCNDDHGQDGDNHYSKETTEDRKQKINRTWRVLHATAAVRCHPTLFKIACAMHPEQAREIDNNDLYYNTTSALGGRDEINNHNSNRRTSLHFAAQNTSMTESRDIIQLLLSLYPEAASIPNPADGYLPLHYLCKNDSKVHWFHDGFSIVYNAHPRAALVQDMMGCTPLHHAAGVLASRQNSLSNNVRAIVPFGSPMQAPPDALGLIIKELLRTHPTTANMVDNEGKLPMHIIAERAETWDDTVQVLYDIFPAAIRKRTNLKAKGKCPIHLVASNPDAQADLVSRIVENHPQGSTLMDKNGRLPLHYACEAGKSWDYGIQNLYNAYPTAIKICEDNEQKWFPLHFIAACPSASLDSFLAVLNLYPQAAKEVDGLGKTVLHLIVESGRNWDFVGLAFRAYPDAINVEDSRRRIPLVTAALRCACDSTPTGTTATNSSPGYSSSSNQSVHSPSCSGESGGVSRSASMSRTNVFYNLLRAAPHLLPDS